MYTARPLAAVAEIAADEWNRLLGPTGPPFLDWRFLAALERSGCVGGRTGWIPQHLTLWRGDDLVAAAPAYVKLHSMGEFVFDHSWADLGRRLGIAYYPKLVIAAP